MSGAASDPAAGARRRAITGLRASVFPKREAMGKPLLLRVVQSVYEPEHLHLKGPRVPVCHLGSRRRGRPPRRSVRAAARAGTGRLPADRMDHRGQADLGDVKGPPGRPDWRRSKAGGAREHPGTPASTHDQLKEGELPHRRGTDPPWVHLPTDQQPAPFLASPAPPGKRWGRELRAGRTHEGAKPRSRG